MLGPISATVHVMDDETKDEVITELQELHSSNPDMQKYVDLHLIVDQYDRQFNMWRNVAKLFARTDYIMMLDVDFHLCTDLRKSIRGNPEIMDRLREGRTALVVPAFEFDNLDDGNDWRTFPTKKDDLMELVQEDKIGMFHKGWFKGHGSTNYTQWYETDKLYPVTRYDFSYEPYIIYKKEGSPWCEERFVGYGANKAACLYEIFLSGIEYWVLPNDFLIHQTHRYPEDARRKEVSLVYATSFVTLLLIHKCYSANTTVNCTLIIERKFACVMLASFMHLANGTRHGLTILRENVERFEDSKRQCDPQSTRSFIYYTTPHPP